MSGVKLRKYQVRILDGVKDAMEQGYLNMLIVAATGTGKTVLFTHLQEWIGRKGTVLVIVHRDELLTQTRAKWIRSYPDAKVGLEMGKRRALEDEYDIIVASRQSLKGDRLENFYSSWRNDITTIIVDEAHHIAAQSYVDIITKFGCLPVDKETGNRGEGASDILLVGVTATPDRADKKNIQTILPFLAAQYHILEAMKDRWLCHVRGWKVETKTSLKGVSSREGDYVLSQLQERVDNEQRQTVILEKVRKLAKKYDRKRILVFCSGISHAYHSADAYRKHFRNVYTVTSETEKEYERPHMIQQFMWGPTPAIMTNVDVFTEGTDIPQIDMIVMEAPTKDGSRFIQKAGRGLRPFDGTDINPLTGLADQMSKDFLILLDVVDEDSGNSLVTTPRILGLPSNFDLEGDDLLQARETLDDILERDPMLAGSLNRLIESGEQLPKNFADLKAQLKRLLLFAPTDLRGRAALYSDFSWLVADEEAMIADDAHSAKRYTLVVPRPKKKEIFPGDNRIEPPPFKQIVQERIYTLYFDDDTYLWRLEVDGKTDERTAIEEEIDGYYVVVRKEGLPRDASREYYQKISQAKKRAQAIPLERLGTWSYGKDFKKAIQIVDEHIRNRHFFSIPAILMTASWRKDKPSDYQIKKAKSLNIPTNTKMRKGDLSDLIENHEIMSKRLLQNEETS